MLLFLLDTSLQTDAVVVNCNCQSRKVEAASADRKVFEVQLRYLGDSAGAYGERTSEVLLRIPPTRSFNVLLGSVGDFKPLLFVPSQARSICIVFSRTLSVSGVAC